MTEPIERNATPSAVAQQPRLLDQVRAAIRTRHYSLRTEQAYCHWIKRYILFHGKRHPLDMGETAITRLARRLDILDLARMIGHANLGELRTYYRERAEDIAARL